jgi:peptidoglycan/xylan/chitin deacetylase (PgdA/CDA1 family)
LARLSRADLKVDLSRNLDFLEELLGERPRWFSYPYGNRSAVPADTAALFREQGVSFAATLFRGWIYRGHNPLRLNRINTNEVSAFVAA